MNRNVLSTVLVAGLVVLAGCAGGITGSPDGSASGETTDAQSPADGTDGGTGTVNLYISDERNAIGDFEHLNVTITRVGLKPAGDDAGDPSEESDDADDESDDEMDDAETEEVENDDRGETDDNETATSTDTPTNATDTATESDGDDPESEIDADEDGDGEWVEYEVDNRTVDLTRLQGANATKLSSLDAPNGTYEKVFVYVSDVNGTLKDGSDQRVKLPSGKLQLNSEFTVGDGESVDFVFDITAVKAGQSGKYILKPVISESGTDVDIDRVDEGDADDRDNDGGADNADRGDRADDAESSLNASFVGDVARGENATISVTRNGAAVPNATVATGERRLGTTDADGTLSFAVPEDVDELEVTVTRDGAETELEVEFDDDQSTEAGSNEGADESSATAD